MKCPVCGKEWKINIKQWDLTVHDEYLVVWAKLWCNDCGKSFEVNAKTSYSLEALDRG